MSSIMGVVCVFLFRVYWTCTVKIHIKFISTQIKIMDEIYIEGQSSVIFTSTFL